MSSLEVFVSLSYQLLPEKPGIYIFRGKVNEVLYVGKAVNLKKRVASYFQIFPLGEKTRALISQIKKIDHIVVESEIEALLLEANLIKKWEPKFNVNFKDGKAYPFIKITTKDAYPRVTTSRRIENEKEIFFGPYPETKTMYNLSKIIRRIFPYRSCRVLPKKPCLYYHINRCPGFCVNRSLQLKKDYKKTIKKIILFLEAKENLVIKILEREMHGNAETQNFEKAQKIKEQIEKIREILKPIHRPFEYIENPNLLADIRANEVRELFKVLGDYFPFPSSILHLPSSRIECYDVSNIQGKSAAGSMVVFVNGEPDKSKYRKFEIKFKKTPDDLAMLREVLERRVKHKEWPYPDLIVIDGGETQVLTGLKVLKKRGLKIPIISLAKKLESIYLPVFGKSKFKVLSLPATSAGLHLLQRLRDEAHRFAITYHRKLRKLMLQ